MPTVRRTLTIPRSPDVVWKQFTSQEALRKWFDPTLTIDLRRGGAFRLRCGDGDTRASGVVLDLVPGESFVLSWLEADAGWQYPARLTITLEPTDDGTIVTIIHDGFPGIGTDTWERTEQAYEEGVDKHALLHHLSDVVLAS